MSVPEAFGRAYEGAEDLVRRIAAGEISAGGIFGEEVDAWRRESCLGSSTLAEAAVLALKYALASAGEAALAGGKEDLVGSMKERLGALSLVERVLRPPGAGPEDSGEEAEISPAELPEEFRQSRPNARGYTMGPLQVVFEPYDGPPHGHLSVSHPSRYPTIPELKRAATAPGGPPPNLWALIPKPDEDAGAFVVDLYVMPPEERLG